MVFVDADEAGVCSMKEEAEGRKAEPFAGVSAIQARAGALVFFDGFLGDGLGRGSVL